MSEPGSAEQQLEQRIDFLVRELDEFCGMANNPETLDLIEGQADGIGQIQFRAALILDFLSDVAPTLRVVR